MATAKFKITRAQVISDIKGWVTFTIDEDGVQVQKKARAKNITFTDDLRTLRRIGNTRHDCSRYEKVASANANSSMDCADQVAVTLRGMDLEKIYAYAAKTLHESVEDLKAKYKHLNLGMQRMNLGNRIRAMLKDAE